MGTVTRQIRRAALSTVAPAFEDLAADAVHVDVAVVIPAFNEAEGVGPTVDRVRSALLDTPYTHDVIVVDDGSTDRTAIEAEKRGARVIRLADNCGYGAALKAGIRRSKSSLVVITDADGTYPPEAISTLLERMEDADMVVGARSMTDTSIPAVRRPAKIFLGMLASYLAGRRIPDLNSGLRVMRRSVLLRFMHLLPAGFSFTTTITLSMLCTNHVVHYVPIACAPRLGSSKLRPREFTAFILLVLRTVVLFNPLKIFMPLGTMLFAVSSVKLMYDLFRWNLSETVVMAFLASIIVWSVGLLADMIARLELNGPGAV